MEYTYNEYAKIAKVGDVVRAVPGKQSPCAVLGNDGVDTGTITKVATDVFCIEGCSHHSNQNGYLFLVSSAEPSWETLKVGDELAFTGKNSLCAKILEIGASGKTFLRSNVYSEANKSINFERTGCWMTIAEAKEDGWKIVPPFQEMTVEEVSKLVGKPVKIVESK